MADYRKVFGRIVTDAEGAVGGVSVTVNRAGTLTAITLKDNKAGTEALANPFDTDAHGVWSFFTDIDSLSGCDWEVDIVFAKSGLDFSTMNEMYENVTINGIDVGAVLKTDFDATTLLYATLDNTPVATTPTEFMAVLSGQATAAFDWGGQDLLNLGVVFLAEQAAAEADRADEGQIWVKTGAPNTLWFTNDAGTDQQVVYAGGAFHDGFSDFVANKHIDHTSVTLSAGNGMTGGGTIAANRSFAVGPGTGIVVSSTTVGVTGVLEDLFALTAPASDGQFIVATGVGAFQYELPAVVMATLSGGATSAFAWNSQNLTGIGELSMAGMLTVGINGTGHDVQFYGDESGSYMLWDQSDERLNIIRTNIGETQGNYGLAMNNSTAAVFGAQQYSPPIRLRGMGFLWNVATVTAAPVAAGTGYAVGDVLTLNSGGAESDDCTVTVTAETGGAVDTVELTSGGTSGYTVSTYATTNDGAGNDDCTIAVASINTPESQSIDFRTFVRPIEGSTVTGALDFQSSIDAGSYTDLVTLLSNGYFGVLTTAPSVPLHVVGDVTFQETILTVERSGAAGVLFFDTYSTSTGHKGHIFLRKSASDTLGTLVATGNNDSIGTISAWGIDSDVTRFKSAAINFIQEGAAEATLVPSRITFETTNAGGSYREVACITPLGDFAIGATTIDASAAKNLIIASGTTPAAHTDDQAYLWVEDVGGTATYAGLHMMGENGANSYKQIVVGAVIKTDTGQTATPHEGMIEINTFDDTLKMYADGGWRDIAADWT